MECVLEAGQGEMSLLPKDNNANETLGTASKLHSGFHDSLSLTGKWRVSGTRNNAVNVIKPGRYHTPPPPTPTPRQAAMLGISQIQLAL